MTDKIAYKVLTADEWAALSAGPFHGAPIDQADGFIHLSTASQLTETVDRHFGGQQESRVNGCARSWRNQSQSLRQPAATR